MDLRTRISAALKAAMKDREANRLGTLRLINAAIKDRDIAARTGDTEEGVSETELLAILARMVKQRQESARAYEEGGRLDLAERERAEIAVIEEYLPRQLTADEVDEAIGTAIVETEANSIRDMGRVMAQLKARYAGRMDFAAVGPMVRQRLS
ncbi:GatB/YqeY domain-containing protein [Rhodovulum sulfidophilum]|uniref:GatB/YqeY domain-containing protein n=1 Tax=Rhodovulum sulfidophilum TaxID=35806 RepID=A0ABS1RP65_RHOSU|nr:GatB/YqeY domain-containing protein [Rhodovulum sulfidophilum]MBL3607862.1 GatB/YqeY domain-containing protein [Rhodovulum sulfidophilum]MCE8458417.1 GatB/YqeY domain-containing protein [Rhodovulum sulfidophilum]